MRISSRLSLRYEKGSFGLTRINASADNQNLLNLALAKKFLSCLVGGQVNLQEFNSCGYFFI